jgi:hypothetical protein
MVRERGGHTIATGFHMRFAARRILPALLLTLLVRSTTAQLHEIDPNKLPQDTAVQTTYQKLVPMEQYAQAWSNVWRYTIPKKQVAAEFTSGLDELTKAAKTAPDNRELQLLTGLVAHLAYNLDVEKAYQPAVGLLTKAAEEDPTDVRGDWFLGIHLCQADLMDKGMDRLLSVEARQPWQKLPIDFWADYMTCSTVALMPAHTLRAIDHAIQLGSPAEGFQQMKEIAEKRYKSSEPDVPYAKGDVWQADQAKDDFTFTNYLCGFAFQARANWGVGIQDVNKNTCVAQLEPPAYPARHGSSSPTVLVLARLAKSGESLADFTQGFLEGKYPGAVHTQPVRCPADTCQSFEITKMDMYPDQGGARLLAVTFERDMPQYDGLLLERPSQPPKGNAKDKVTFYHPEERFRRFPGKMYYLVILDSNASIFEPAKRDFDFVLNSLAVE